MKTVILIIIAGVCLFLFIMSSVYGDDSVDLTDEQAENIRQQLNEQQDKDINLDKEE